MINFITVNALGDVQLSIYYCLVSKVHGLLGKYYSIVPEAESLQCTGLQVGIMTYLLILFLF